MGGKKWVIIFLAYFEILLPHAIILRLIRKLAVGAVWALVAFWVGALELEILHSTSEVFNKKELRS